MASNGIFIDTNVLIYHTFALFDIDKCRVSTGWMSYNYLKSQYLLEGCKSEILEFLQPD